MSIDFKPAPADFADEYIRLRGIARENAVSRERLGELGITAESWGNDIERNEVKGIIALESEKIVGYCFCSVHSGEIIVLAVLPAFEGLGIGRRLLESVVEVLRDHGLEKPFLGCSSDPTVRSHGFYRHLGWRSTGTVDERGDEVLVLLSGGTGDDGGSDA